MYQVRYQQGNGQDCPCCRVVQAESEEYFTEEEALQRAADLHAHAEWGQDINGIRVIGPDGDIGLDNQDFESRIRLSISLCQQDYFCE